jgi:membrane protein implicated in regulation of membrane protease activity
MKKLVGKFGKYYVAAFIIMGVGLIIFLVTPLLLWLFDMDSDIVGFLIFLVGLVMYVVRLVVRKVRSHKQAS